MSKQGLPAAAVLAVLLLSCGDTTPRFSITSAERRGVLESNGLRFVIMPDATTKLAEVDIRYDVGAREDPQGKAGLAHLVEHLMFQTRPDGANSAPLFQSIIELATDFNAYTNWDTTHYRMTSGAENLDSMLKIEAMRMFYAADIKEGANPFGCSTVPSSEFEREREVVRNEIRAGSSADDYIVQLVEASIYPKGHAYERLVGGNDKQIASASLEDACDFMQKYYAPERATLVIAGNVDIDKTVELIKKWYGKIPKRAGAARVQVAPFVAQHRTIEIEANVERPSVWIGWALPPANTPEGEAAQAGVFGTLIRTASAARDYEFAYKVEPAILGGQLAPLFLMKIELRGMNKLDEALQFAKSSSSQAHRGFDGGTYQDLEEEKAREKAQLAEALEQLKGRTELVAGLVQFTKDFDFNSSDQYIGYQLHKIDTFDNGLIAKAVKSSLDWDKASIVVVKPNEKGIQGDTRSSVKPQAKSDAAMTDPEVDPRDAHRPVKIDTQLDALKNTKRFKLDNGMDVVLLPTEGVSPLAAATLIFKNTGEASTPDNPALAPLAASFLVRAPDVDPQMARNTDVFSRTGVEMQCATDDDATYCFTHGVNIYVDVMIKGLERLVTAGGYSQQRIEFWQKDTRDSFKLRSVQAENEYIRQTMTALYGPDHPYTRSSVLTPASADRVHKDALDAFRKKHYTAGNATLIVTGKFDPAFVEKVVRETYGGWDKGTVDAPVAPTPYKRTGPAFIGVVKPKVDQQVTVTLAYPAPAGIDGQEGARRVLTEMLNIRAEDIRFKLGSTYGLGIARQPKKGPSAYILRGGAVLGGTIDAERAGESIKALRTSLDELRAGDHFDEHFVRARRKLLSTLLTESTVTRELAQRLGTIAIFGLDDKYYNTLLKQTAAVSIAQVKALLKNEIDPANEVVTVLGDKAHLDKTFSDAGIKDVKIVEPDWEK